MECWLLEIMRCQAKPELAQPTAGRCFVSVLPVRIWLERSFDKRELGALQEVAEFIDGCCRLQAACLDQLQWSALVYLGPPPPAGT